MSYWDRVAKTYRFFIGKDSKAYAAIEQRVISRLSGEESILEIGSGPGIFAEKLAPHCRQMMATDYSEAMVEQAKRYLEAFPNVAVRQEDVHQLSFPSDSFDIVFIANTLHIIEDPAGAVAECLRVLKPGGLFIAPNFVESKGLKARISRRILSISGCKVFTLWPYPDYLVFLRQQGLEIVEAERIPASIDIAYVVSRRR